MKNRKLIGGLLVFALAIWAFNFRQIWLRTSEGGSPDGPASPMTTVEMTGSEPFLFPDSLKDPFDRHRRSRVKSNISPITPKRSSKPVAPTAEAGPPPYAIDGLLWDEKKPTVVLRHTETGDVRMLGKGEVWDSPKVNDIRPDRVLLRCGRREFMLQ